MNRLNKKLSKLSGTLMEVYKKQLPVVIFFLLLTHFFVIIRALPYINIIEHYYFYVTGIYFILFLAIYRKQITPKRILIGLEILLVISIVTTLINIQIVGEMVGFLVVTILIVIIFTTVISERKTLRDNN